MKHKHYDCIVAIAEGNPVEFSLDEKDWILYEIEKHISPIDSGKHVHWRIKKEPVYQYREIGEGNWIDCKKEWFDYCSKQPEMDTRILYTSPQPREWVGLNRLDIENMYGGSVFDVIKRVEAKLKQLNTKG